MARPEPEVNFSEIGQISVTVKDLERATAFYRDTLGMRFLFGASKMAFFDCGGIRLMLATPEKDEFDHPASIIYYKVKTLQDTFQTLKDRGVQFEAEPAVVHKTDAYDLWMAFFRDTEGNLLAMMSEDSSKRN